MALHFSARETEILAAAWSCLDGGDPKVNYQKLAEATGMTNPGSAYNAWTKIRNKIAGKSRPQSASKKQKSNGARKLMPSRRAKTEKPDVKTDPALEEDVSEQEVDVEAASAIKKIESE